MFPFRDHNPSSRLPVVTWALIAVNVAIHLWVMAAAPGDAARLAIYDAYAMWPARISRGLGLETLVTSAFLHADLLHLAGNMLFLWVFGDNLEDMLGRIGFLLFYLAGAVGAALTQWAVDPFGFIPTIGASGAIAAVMGGYLLLFPRARVDILVILIVFVRVFPVPAWAMLGLWFLLQLLLGLGSDVSAGGVAYWAHAGGFAIGFLLMLPVWLLRGGPGFWERTEGHPPHPEATWEGLRRSSVPRVRRSK